jgi:hypothetical protein
MKENLARLEVFWSFSDTWKKASEFELSSFQEKYNVIIPDDMKMYFAALNGTGPYWDENLLTFYPLSDVKSIGEDLINYGGSPNYTNLSNTLDHYRDCFVFADYSLNVFAYAIRLYSKPTESNEVYTVCGDEYKVIANSFKEFIGLYLQDFNLVTL